MCHITFFFLFYSGFDFSTRICGSFRKRFHNNSSKKLLSSEAQTEGTSLFLVQFFFSALNFLNERSRIINVGVVFQSAQNIRAQNPMILVQALPNEYLFASQSSLGAFLNFLSLAKRISHQCPSGSTFYSLTLQYTFSMAISF